MFTGNAMTLRTRAPADAKNNDLAFIVSSLLRGFALDVLQIERTYVVIVGEGDFRAGDLDRLADERQHLGVFVLRGGTPDPEEAVAVGENADRAIFLQDADLRAIHVRRAGAAGNTLRFVARDVDDLAGQRH